MIPAVAIVTSLRQGRCLSDPNRTPHCRTRRHAGRSGPFVLDTHLQALLRGREPLPLGRRAVAVLQVLVQRAGDVVTKDELLAAAWDGMAVEESNLPVQVAALRRVFAAEPDGADWIETLSRRGYRFNGPAVLMNSPAVTEPPRSASLPPRPRTTRAALPSRCCRSAPPSRTRCRIIWPMAWWRNWSHPSRGCRASP